MRTGDFHLNGCGVIKDTQFSFVVISSACVNKMYSVISCRVETLHPDIRQIKLQILAVLSAPIRLHVVY